MDEFQKLLASNTELKAKIETLNKDPKATAADFIALMKEYGVNLTEADFQRVPAESEVSDDELEAVAGGDRCFCIAGGGGTGDEHHSTCACIAAGHGHGKKPGERSWDKYNCTCFVGGAGAPTS